MSTSSMPAGADLGHAPRVAAGVGAMLGEGPAWDAARQCLWFVDIKGHTLHRFDPARGEVEDWAAPDEPCWVVPTADGTLIVGAKAGVHRFDVVTGTFERLLAVESALPGNRLNDAAVHPDGSIWFGTMDNAEQAATGSYYRLFDGSCRALDTDAMVITNGPAFSPTGDTVYFVDTLDRAILAAPVRADGFPGVPRLFARLPEDLGYPDGPTVDSVGTVWVGLFGGWGVARFASDGALLGRVDFPVANVTKVTFGGEDLRRVYATTARKGLSAAERAQQPHAGDLFTFDVEVPGLPPRPPTY